MYNPYLDELDQFELLAELMEATDYQVTMRRHAAIANAAMAAGEQQLRNLDTLQGTTFRTRALSEHNRLVAEAERSGFAKGMLGEGSEGF